MITRELAEQLSVGLHRRGRGWSPAPGDRFLVPDRDLDDEVFVVADMAIGTAELPHGAGTEMRFNGTVEWALDSLAQAEVVWLPREEQLRALLGPAFARLEAVPGPPGGSAVALADGRRFVDTDAERAYARALLAVLDEADGRMDP